MKEEDRCCDEETCCVIAIIVNAMVVCGLVLVVAHSLDYNKKLLWDCEIMANNKANKAYDEYTLQYLDESITKTLEGMLNLSLQKAKVMRELAHKPQEGDAELIKSLRIVDHLLERMQKKVDTAIEEEKKIAERLSGKADTAAASSS
jgi:hypothetical protein